MKFKENYSYTNMDMIQSGYAALTVDSLVFDRYFTEEEKEQNRKEAERLYHGKEWDSRCDAMSRRIYQQMEPIVSTLERLGYVDREENHVKDTNRLYFWCNRGWNGKDYFDTFRLSFNVEKPEDVFPLEEKIISILEKLDNTDNVICRIQYGTWQDSAKLNHDFEYICKSLDGKIIDTDIGRGRIKRFENQWGFQKLRVRKSYYPLNEFYVIRQFSNLLKEA